MSVNSQYAAKTVNPLDSAFGVGSVVFVLLGTVFLHVLGVPLTTFVLLVAATTLLGSAFRYPITAVGTVLAFMPIYTIAFLLAKFFGPSYVAVFEGADRAVLLLLAFVLWRRNGVKFLAPDWFLLMCFGLSIARLIFGGSLIILLADFSFMIAYAVGRVTTLELDRQRVWATCAVWIIAVLSLVGMSEVFVFGPGPRALLYSSAYPGFTPDGATLGGEFFAESFARLRESATMISPPYFALLCMTALVLWWVYCRNPVPAVMIAAGLICTVTRSAWMGTALAIPLIAVKMGQRKRFLRYASVGVALFIASIPVVGLTDFLTNTKNGEEASAVDHKRSLIDGLEYVVSHPFGAGPGNYDRPAGALHSVETTSNAPFIEDSYLVITSEYGILAGLCFVGFVLSALRVVWPLSTQLGYAAAGTLVGFGAAIVVAPLHQDFALASWIWFLVGFGVRSSGDIHGRSVRV